MANVSHEEIPVKTDILLEDIQQERKIPNGEAGAAILAAGIGCLTMGLLTAVAAIWGSLHTFLQFYPPAGSITGITIVMVIAWLASWFVLYRFWKDKQVNLIKVFVLTLAFILLGVVGIFPPFIHLFA